MIYQCFCPEIWVHNVDDIRDGIKVYFNAFYKTNTVRQIHKMHTSSLIFIYFI